MSDVNFNCPHCGQNLDAPEEIAGREIECPTCGRDIGVPDGPSAAAEDGKSATGPLRDLADEEKGSTVKIDLPEDPDLRRNRAPRVIRIKRVDS
jgi:DNA-directed RNA polymerase subunit RPC12/RpoP